MPLKNVPLKAVVDLYVRCSYPLRPDAIAASDTCQRPADTAVIEYLPFDGKAYYYRCSHHRGLTHNGQPSTVVEEVPYRAS